MASIVLMVSPILTMTGPILTNQRILMRKRMAIRWRYYTPFIVAGLFLYIVVAKPLTELMPLFYHSDFGSVLIFSMIFEIFVYANFCGLSLLIYGLLGLIGLRVPLNFKQPFSAHDLMGFWKGWHRSLSIVLKELFYKRFRRYGLALAIFTSFVASGLWHGVTLNFIAWGLFHAAGYVIALRLKSAGVRSALLHIVIMILFIIYGRLLFSESSTKHMIEKISPFSGDTSFWLASGDGIAFWLSLPIETTIALMVGLSIIVSEMLFRNTKLFRGRRYMYLRNDVSQIIMLTSIVLLASASVGSGFAVYGQR